jgi:hypothetical protein
MVCSCCAERTEASWLVKQQQPAERQLAKRYQRCEHGSGLLCLGQRAAVLAAAEDRSGLRVLVRCAARQFSGGYRWLVGAAV